MKALQTKPVLFSIVFCLVLASLAVWHGMPIYPDEYSLRMEVGRFIQDKGFVSGLFSLCVASVEPVPLLFVMPAWLFSQMDLHFTSVQIRALPFAMVLGCAFLTAYYAIRNINPIASLLVTAAMVGVACSSLVFARYEFVLFINMFFGVLALNILSYHRSPLLLRAAVSACLIASALTSVYVHPQGIIFLPLTAYLSYRLVAIKAFDTKIAFLWIIGFCFTAYTAHVFHALSCNEHPAIATFFSNMVFQPNSLQDIKWISYLTTKLATYVDVFTYRHVYSAHYLPGLSAEKITMSGIGPILNIAIPAILVVVMLLSAIIALGIGGIAFYYYFIKRKPIPGLNTDAVITYFLIAVPIIFLFLYDAKQYFYRSIVINFMLTVALVIILSNLHYRFVARLASWLGAATCVICLGSIIANHIFFDMELRAYEGPGVSVSRNLVQLQSKVQDLAKSCGIDFTKGGGVIDDLTYDSVKQYHKVYPITYMGLQMGLIKASASDVIKLLKPNYVLARCTEMQATGIGWPADVNSGELCCTRLNK